MRQKALGLVLILLLLAAFRPSPTGATPPPPPLKGAALELESEGQPSTPIAPEILRRIEPALLKQMAEGEEKTVSFLVYLTEEADLVAATEDRVSASERRQAVITALQATAERSQGQLRAYLNVQRANGKVRRYAPYWIFNGLAVEGNRETLLALAARPEVKILRADRIRYLEGWDTASSDQVSTTVEWNIAKIRADLVWQALDVDGSGVVVANMDSGVDWQHPALQTKYRGYDPHGLYKHFGNWYCATDEGYTYPYDGHGHGTHTMGTIVGGGDPAIGVAPGARWIAVKAFRDDGYSYDSWLHAGFQWLLDPDGDPGTDDAPDVVNNSWGSSEGYLETFRPDVQALLAADIFTVFSAGNDGPAEYTVGSPASFPESFAAGATNSDDYVAYFSSRGPSPWSEIKPEVCAPGVNVRSSLPGGSYGERQGTSMAAPHVAGLAALLLEAEPTLTVSDIEQAITSTAVSLGSPIPNNDHGWGRIDAYNAVAAVSNAGFLNGTVTDSTNGAPLAEALVTITPHGGGPSVEATTDSQGHYSAALAPDTYDVTAAAFAYEASTAYNVVIVRETTTVQDFTLDRSPVGALLGRVTEVGTGAYLPATVIVPGTPAKTQTDPTTGLYSLALPAGTYDLRVESPGHRVGRAHDVPVVVGQAATRDFALETAPTILLVDSGAWYGGSEIIHFRQALDDLNYLYDLWTIHEPFETPNDVPTADDLLAYDIVIWSCPEDSPGYVNAWGALTGYLDAGGLLFLTGQDIGYWDGGGFPFAFSPEYEDYLKASYVADNAGTLNLTSIAGEIFEGLAPVVEGGDGADNQRYPDVITVAAQDYATSVIEYQDDGSGGQRVGLCLPYRLVYLSFGFEGINQRETRRQVMERTIDWLISPRQTVGVELSPAAQTQIGLPTTTVTHTVRLRNTGDGGESASNYSLGLSGQAWPTTLATNSVELGTCDSIDIDLWVNIPAGEGWQSFDAATLTAYPVSSPTFVATSTLTTKTPAPVLLVDDDRWYDQENHYQNALEGNGIPYDYWEVNDDWPWESPPLDLLQRYPIVVWFTSYDWFQPLTVDEETTLTTYLDRDGRLFFSSQDYLYQSGVTSFGQGYLGVLSYTEDMITNVAVGERGSLIGDSLGHYDLAYPFANYSDALTPTLAAEVGFRGHHELPIGLAHTAPAFRTVFFAFPFEALDSAPAKRVMQRVTGWLSWLGTSDLTADRNVVASGGTMTYTLTLNNDGWETVTGHLSNTLPVEISYVPNTLSPPTAVYEPTTKRVSWDGTLLASETLIVNYQASVDPLPSGTIISNVATLGYDEHSIAFDRWARTWVDIADLSASTMEVDRGTARPGDSLFYTVTLRNAGFAAASPASLVNPIPEYTTYIPNSLSISGGGVGTEDGGVITWTGQIDIGSSVTITYGVTVNARPTGFSITNRATVYDDYGNPVELTAHTLVPQYKYYLPLMSRASKKTKA